MGPEKYKLSYASFLNNKKKINVSGPISNSHMPAINFLVLTFFYQACTL